MSGNSQTSSLPWRRHDLLTVAPDAWASALAEYPPLPDHPLLAAWADRGWPVIIRCRAKAEARGLLPVGIPLPPFAGKARLALVLPPDAVLQRSSPSSLRAAAAAADRSWRSTIAALLDVGARNGVVPSAFGSLLWQHQTCLSYLSPASDLDVLWPVPAGFDALPLLSNIAAVQRGTQLRIDGEVIFADGSAVNWRELWNAYRSPDGAAVLAKTMDGVRLVEVAALQRIGQHA